MAASLVGGAAGAVGAWWVVICLRISIPERSSNQFTMRESVGLESISPSHLIYPTVGVSLGAFLVRDFHQ